MDIVEPRTILKTPLIPRKNFYASSHRPLRSTARWPEMKVRHQAVEVLLPKRPSLGGGGGAWKRNNEMFNYNLRGHGM